jgi:hypothetical protein
MNERDKLIELIEKGQTEYYNSFGNNGIRHNEYIADHLLANGVIVPPCKVRDVFYRLIRIREKPCIDELKVSSLTIKADGSYKIRLTSGLYRSVFEITPNTLRQTVFLSREEAEKALEETKL